MGSMGSSQGSILVSVFARTDIGLKRTGNEDAFLVADLSTGRSGLGPEISNHAVGERGSLMVVSDGMGGAAAGEIASEMSVKTLLEALQNSSLELEIGDRLNKATEIANERVWNTARQNPKLAGMGATLTAVLVHQNLAYIAQVGDSRAYLIRGGRIKQLTKDQSLIQLLTDSGALQPDQLSAVPHNVIMQALGTAPTVQVAMSVVELSRNDQLLLCSDGLSNKLEPEEMARVVEEAESITAACRRLVELANERGGDDNITVIVASFDGEGLDSAAECSITGSYRVLSQGCFGGDLSHVSSQFAGMQERAAPEEVTTQVMEALSAEPESMAQAPVCDTPRTAPAEAPAAAPASRAGSYLILGLIIGFVILIVLGLASYWAYRRYVRSASERKLTSKYHEVGGRSKSGFSSPRHRTS
jgi:serine/threonine protein phosphatase PrpC